jgi:hypothetical protein
LLADEKIVGLAEETRQIKQTIFIRETMKTLLKPTLAKMILALVLFIISSDLWRMYVISTISDTITTLNLALSKLTPRK